MVLAALGSFGQVLGPLEAEALASQHRLEHQRSQRIAADQENARALELAIGERVTGEDRARRLRRLAALEQQRTGLAQLRHRQRAREVSVIADLFGERSRRRGCRRRTGSTSPAPVSADSTRIRPPSVMPAMSSSSCVDQREIERFTVRGRLARMASSASRPDANDRVLSPDSAVSAMVLRGARRSRPRPARGGRAQRRRRAGVGTRGHDRAHRERNPQLEGERRGIAFHCTQGALARQHQALGQLGAQLWSAPADRPPRAGRSSRWKASISSAVGGCCGHSTH